MRHLRAHAVHCCAPPSHSPLWVLGFPGRSHLQASACAVVRAQNALSSPCPFCHVSSAQQSPPSGTCPDSWLGLGLAPPSGSHALCPSPPLENTLRGSCQVLLTVPSLPSIGPAWLIHGIQYVFFKGTNESG